MACCCGVSRGASEAVLMEGPPPPTPFDADQESLLPKKPRAAEGSSACAMCCGLSCGCCLITFLLLLVTLVIKAAVAPAVVPTLNVFEVTNADDLVANMPFMRTGPMPGIWWMDQYGNHLDAVPADYPYYFPYGAPEALASLHDSMLIPSTTDPDEMCYYPVGGGGVSENATWAYYNTNGEGQSYYWPLLNPPSESSEYTGMAFCMVNDSYIYFTNTSSSVQSMTKTEWGWSRMNSASKLPPAVASFESWWMSVFWPNVWGVSDVDYTRDWHYPVFQIIDADGKPTEHFDAFLAFNNKAVPCKSSWLSWLGLVSPWWRPYVIGKENYCNEGPGTMLWPPLMATPPGPPCRPFCEYANATAPDENATAAPS